MKINNYVWENDLSLNDLVLKQKEEIERLHSIIKEVREYIEKYREEKEKYKLHDSRLSSIKLLEILDKENK